MPKDDEKEQIGAEVTLQLPVVPDPVMPDKDDLEAKPPSAPPTQEECDRAVENSRRALATLGIIVPKTAPPIKPKGT